MAAQEGSVLLPQNEQYLEVQFEKTPTAKLLTNVRVMCILDDIFSKSKASGCVSDFFIQYLATVYITV